jgi:hypothetical protein
MFDVREAKSDYIYNLDAYTVAHPTSLEHNMPFIVVDRLCGK